jgi:AcrR family transcriptional regulator
MSTPTKGHAEETAHRNRGRRRDEDARKRILDAALELLEDFGFAKTTADGIADRAGTGKATLYRWWPNKTAVMIEALREAVAQDLAVPDTGDLSEDIRFHLRNLVKLLSGRRGRILKALVFAAHNDPEVAEAFQTLWRKPWRRTAKIGLERHRRKALRETVDLDVVLDVMFGPLYYRLLVGGNALATDYADALTDIIVRGILKG